MRINLFARDFFVIGYRDDPAIKIDGSTLQVTDYGNPGAQFYGMALDARGHLWVSDRSNLGRLSHLDPGTETWNTITGGGGQARGIMVDGDVGVVRLLD